jgi:hypothetical protein
MLKGVVVRLSVPVIAMIPPIMSASTVSVISADVTRSLGPPPIKSPLMY